MVESSDLQGAIQRTQAMERIQALQAQQDEINKKRFELERDRDRAEKGKKVQDPREAEGKRVLKDRYDREGSAREEKDAPGVEDDRGEEAPPRNSQEGDAGNDEEEGGRIDVRV